MDSLKKLVAQDGEAVLADGNGRQHSDMQSVQNMESVINEGIRLALLEDTPDQSLGVLLEHLGKALKGERTYIFEQNESGGDDNTYEWVADGVVPEKENLQNVPPEVCEGWYRNFNIGRHIVIEEVEDIRETEPLQYENLKRQNIQSLVVVPLYSGEEVIGFYGVDNPPVKSLEYASNMLQTAAYFIVSSLKQRNLFRKLQKRSYDVLHALSVDYLGIYQVNFDTGECQIYRNSEQMGTICGVNFEEGYQTAMERYISRCVAARDQEKLRAVSQKDYVLDKLRSNKKFYVRYLVKDNDYGMKYMEIHFSATEKAEGENCAIFALRDVNAVVEQEENTSWRQGRVWRIFWREPERVSGRLSWRMAVRRGCMRIGPCGFCWAYRMRSNRRHVTGIGLKTLIRTMWRWYRKRCGKYWKAVAPR